MNITTHFTWEEARCKCGCNWHERPDVKANVIKQANILEGVRIDCGGAPMSVTSWVRCPAHNEAVGGEDNSLHLTGKATDVKHSRMTPTQVAKIARQRKDVGGIGTYATFTHLDHRGYRANWKG